jgi:hypothetical protein
MLGVNYKNVLTLGTRQALECHRCKLNFEFFCMMFVCQQANDEETYIHKMSMSIIDGKLWVILLFCIGCWNIYHTQFIFATRSIIEDYQK